MFDSGILIVLNDQSYIFGSFENRDNAFETIESLWQVKS